jgi:hypothetical protein
MSMGGIYNRTVAVNQRATMPGEAAYVLREQHAGSFVADDELLEVVAEQLYGQARAIATEQAREARDRK